MSTTKMDHPVKKTPRAESGAVGAGAAARSSCLIGLIGAGISRSKSPALHEREGDALGIRCLYQLIDLNEMKLDVAALPVLLESAERMGFAGLNITHPCKQAVIPLLHELSDDARAIGAVNTVHFRNGRRYGYNTDAEGFTENFRRQLSAVAVERVLQLGAGGAGAATAYAMLRLGTAHLQIFDAVASRATALVENLTRHFDRSRISATSDPAAAIADAQGLVHATPTGTREHPGLPISVDLLRADLWVAEIVYFPLETQLLNAARNLGCRTADGGGMVVFQAAAAFEIFTGAKANVERMLKVFNRIPGD